MYSKNKGMTDRYMQFTPPPGYDGSRFRRRSDGRDDAFPLYAEQVPAPEKDNSSYKKESFQSFREKGTEECIECEPSEEKPSPIASLISKLGSEEILLIALMILLAREEAGGMDTALILALLLCI